MVNPHDCLTSSKMILYILLWGLSFSGLQEKVYSPNDFMDFWPTAGGNVFFGILKRTLNQMAPPSPEKEKFYPSVVMLDEVKAIAFHV